MQQWGNTTTQCNNQATYQRIIDVNIFDTDDNDSTIAVKYHFFRVYLSDEIQVKKIDTNDQLANIFTKGLAAFQPVHKIGFLPIDGIS